MHGSIARRCRRVVLLATACLACAVAGVHVSSARESAGYQEHRCGRHGTHVRPTDRDGVPAYSIRVLP